MAPVHQEMQRWQDTVEQFMPHLSRPQAAGLAWFSFGMVLARSCGLTTVSVLLARLMGQKENTVRQRLREGYQEASRKQGRQRREVLVHTCFAPLLGWILAWWEGPQLTLALDATCLGNRFVVLVIRVLYRESALPVAWVTAAMALLRLLSLEAADQPPERDRTEVLAWLSPVAEASAPRRSRTLESVQTCLDPFPGRLVVGRASP